MISEFIEKIIKLIMKYRNLEREEIVQSLILFCVSFVAMITLIMVLKCMQPGVCF